MLRDNEASKFDFADSLFLSLFMANIFFECENGTWAVLCRIVSCKLSNRIVESDTLYRRVRAILDSVD